MVTINDKCFFPMVAINEKYYFLTVDINDKYYFLTVDINDKYYFPTVAINEKYYFPMGFISPAVSQLPSHSTVWFVLIIWQTRELSLQFSDQTLGK